VMASGFFVDVEKGRDFVQIMTHQYSPCEPVLWRFWPIRVPCSRGRQTMGGFDGEVSSVSGVVAELFAQIRKRRRGLRTSERARPCGHAGLR